MIGFVFPVFGFPTGMAGPGGPDLDLPPVPADDLTPDVGGQLDLPASPEATVWARFVELVTLDPVLRGVATFRVWSGDSSDGDDPASGPQPSIRFSPSSGKSAPFAMGIWSIPMSIHVDLITAGTNVVDSMNLWHAVREVATSPDFREAMREAGVGSVRLTDPAYGVKPTLPKHEPTAEGSITAIGTIELRIYQRRP